MYKVGVLCYLIAIVVESQAQSDVQNFSNGNEQFTADLVKLRYKDAPDKALVCPLSAEIILALVADGAKGETEDQLRQALHLSNRKSTRSAVKTLIPLLNKSANDFTLSLADKIYLDNHFKVKQDFKEAAINDYHAEVENLDFTQNTKAAQTINKWVEEKTNGKITNLIAPNQINSQTGLVLVNTLYLNGKWVTPFPKERTAKGTFYGHNDTVETVDMMHSSNSAQYLYFHCGYLQAKFLEIPYQNSSVSMTFILPDDKDGLTNLEQNVELYLKPHNLTRKRVAVTLPKFSISGSQDFKDILEKLGATKVFQPNEADLSGISDQKKLAVDFVVQKVFINVTESGTEAAAATAVGISPTAVVEAPNLTFIADHPFFFIIKEIKSNVILFAGRYR